MTDDHDSMTHVARTTKSKDLRTLNIQRKLTASLPLKMDGKDTTFAFPFEMVTLFRG